MTRPIDRQDRWSLHLDRLDDFAAFASGRGWFRVPTKGAYEVLRMKHPESPRPLVIFRREDAHYATIGRDQVDAHQLLHDWLASTRPPRQSSKNARRRQRIREIKANLRAVEAQRDEMRAALIRLARESGVADDGPAEIVSAVLEELRRGRGLPSSVVEALNSWEASVTRRAAPTESLCHDCLQRIYPRRVGLRWIAFDEHGNEHRCPQPAAQSAEGGPMEEGTAESPQTPSEPPPTVGRIVQFGTGGDDPAFVPAIVTRVWNEACVNLTIFWPDGSVEGRTSVLKAEPLNGVHRWFWPARV